VATKDVCIDGEGTRRCWMCGGRKLEPIGSHLLHPHDAAQGFATMTCERCGSHNRLGHAKNYTGPEDARYRAEWEGEPDSARRAYFDREAAPQQPETLNLQIEMDTQNATPPNH
jgi:hypothetical protein